MAQTALFGLLLADRRRPSAMTLREGVRNAGYVWDPRWPDLVHPFASAVDSPLPEAPEAVHIIQSAKAGWVRLDARDGDSCFDDNPDESLEAWHRRHGVLDE